MELTKEQIKERDEAAQVLFQDSKRCLSEQIAHDHDYGFRLGFTAGVASERKRAQGLVEAAENLSGAAFEILKSNVTEDGWGAVNTRVFKLNEALAQYNQQEAGDE